MVAAFFAVAVTLKKPCFVVHDCRIMRLFLLLALLVQAASMSLARKRRKEADMAWRGLKRECERSRECGGLPPGESGGCAAYCMAPQCYDAVYADSPLEPGELDARRSDKFAECLQELERVMRRAGEWPPRLEAGGSGLRASSAQLGLGSWSADATPSPTPHAEVPP